MNESADPCEDFSNFVCGKFYKNKIIPEELGSFSTFTFLDEKIYEEGKILMEEPVKFQKDFESHKKAKIYYKSCANEVKQNELGTKPLLDIFQEIGGWPIIE